MLPVVMMGGIFYTIITGNIHTINNRSNFAQAEGYISFYYVEKWIKPNKTTKYYLGLTMLLKIKMK